MVGRFGNTSGTSRSRGSAAARAGTDGEGLSGRKSAQSPLSLGEAKRGPSLIGKCPFPVTAFHQSNPVQLLPHAQVYFRPVNQAAHGVLLALSEIPVIHTRDVASMSIATQRPK